MLIWLIQTGESHPFQKGARKMRTAMLAEHLHAKGHSVVWWSSNFFHPTKTLLFNDYKEVEIDQNYTIKLIKGLPYTKNISIKRYIHYKLLAKRFRDMANRCILPDIIVTSMPDYNHSYEAVIFGKSHNIPVVVDIQDIWPDIFIKELPKSFRQVAKLLLTSDFIKLKLRFGFLNQDLGLL